MALIIDNLTVENSISTGSGTNLDSHAARHQPGGADAIPTAAPSTQTPDQANAVGTSANLARADHIHNIATAAPLDIGSANAQGTASTFVKSDHVHRGVRSLKANAGTQRFSDLSLINGTNIVITDDGTGNFTIASTGGGSVTSVAMSVPSFLSVSGSPITTAGTLAVTLAAQAANLVFAGPTVGGAVTPTFRSLVVADIPTAAPSTQTPDQANAVGTSANLARADHIHNIATATAVTISGNANTIGTAIAFARADHTHQLTTIAATAGQIPQYNGTSWIATNFENLPNFNQSIFIYEEFMSQLAATAGISVIGNYNWTTSNVGSGSTANASAAVASNNHPGVTLLTAGSANGRYSGVNLGVVPNQIIVGGGTIQCEYVINIPTLATAGVDYTMRLGMGDADGSVDFVNGIYFEYNRATNVNWLIKTAAASTRTSTDSTVAVATGWIKLTIQINAVASSITYFINGTSVGTITTNIPTSAIGFVAVVISKTSNVSLLYLDSFSMIQKFTTPR